MIDHTTHNSTHTKTLSKKQPGVYSIRHKASGTRYIGSTSGMIARRWNEHRYHFRHNTHRNSHLQNAWHKYGKRAFAWEVLENTSPENAIEAEQFWMDVFRVRQTRLYNMAPIAGSQLGFRHSQKTKDKVARANRGQKRTAAARRRMSIAQKGIKKPAVSEAKAHDWPPLVSPEGDVHKIRNLKRFCDKIGLDMSALRKVAIGQTPQYQGWRLLEPGQKPQPYRGKIRKVGIAHTLVAPDGTVYENVTNVEQFGREHDILPQGLRLTAQGVYMQFKGWHAYRDDCTPKTTSNRQSREWPDFISPSDDCHSCENMYQFCKTHGLDKGAMQRLVKGQVKSHKGWTLAHNAK